MPTYWILYVLAFVVCCIICVFRRNIYGYSIKKAVVLSLLLLPFAFVGCKLLYFIENPSTDIFSLGGMSFYGSVIFIPLFEIPAACIAKVPYAKLMDFIAPCGPLCLGFCRIGCFITGCCGAAPIYIGDTEVIVPIQIIESVLDFALCAFILLREHKRHIIAPGDQTCVFIIAYSFIRLVMEAYRDTPKNIFGMSNGQWLSIISAVVAFAIITVLHNHTTKSA